MYEDYMRKRTNLHNGMHATTNQPDKKRKVGIMGIQIVICVLCIIVSVVIRMMGGSTYATVKKNVAGAINKPVTSSDVQGVLAQIKSNLPDASKIFSGSSATSKNSSESSSSSDSSQASGASSNSGSSASSNNSSQASSSSATSSK